MIWLGWDWDLATHSKRGGKSLCSERQILPVGNVCYFSSLTHEHLSLLPLEIERFTAKIVLAVPQ